MKQIRKIAKLFVPGALMHAWLEKRYGIKIAIPGETVAARLLVGILPYAVSAVLQQRKPMDRRPVKYFLPYGKMRKHVKAQYDMNVGDAERDRGALGAVRAAMPYGLVLWWDGEDVRIAKEIAARKKPRTKNAAATVPASQMAGLAEMKAQVEALRRESGFRADTVEILALRRALDGARPSVTLVLTGCDEVEAVRHALGEHLKHSLYEMEILLAYRAGDGDVADVVAAFAAYDARIKSLDATGKNLAEMRAAALEAAAGDYVAFLNVRDGYANRQALEIVALTAAAEKAKVCCGKLWKKDGGKVTYPDMTVQNRRGYLPSRRPPVPEGLSAVLFDRAWLAASGLKPLASAVSDDVLFLRAAEILAERVFCIGRTVGVAGLDTTADAHTKSERATDALRGFLWLAHFAEQRKSDDLRAMLADYLQNGQLHTLRALAWGADAKQARPLIEELSALVPACKLGEDVLAPLVSVVVPAYNVERYLGQTLDSLVNQTLKSIEIIVVDDGSADGTLEVGKRYAAEHANVRVLHQENSGPSVARNSGMVLARGKYMGFVDGDDYVDPIMYEKLSDMLENDASASFAMCGVQVEFLYEASETYRMWAQRYFDYGRTGTVDIDASSACDINCIACNKLYRSNFLQDNAIRFPEGFKNEDAVFSFFVMGKAHRLIATGEKFYHYVRNDKGIMARQVESFAQAHTLPDALTKAMPLIAEYLVRDDRRDLFGAFYKRLCGAANGFQGEASARCTAQLLHKVGFFYNQEFLDKRDLGWVRNQLFYYHNFDSSDLPPIIVDEGMFPKLRTKRAAVGCPIASVVIPVYNQEKYLTYCLESIRKQTLGEIEILCIDDGSVDHSLDLLRELAACDGRIRVIHRNNAGAGATRNFGIRQASGKYIVFVDADDYVESDYLKTVCGQMERDELDMCLLDLDCFDYKTRKPANHYWSIKNQLAYYPSSRVFAFSDLKQYRCMTGPCTAVWRRGFLVENKIEFPEIANGEDAIFWMRAMPLARRIGLNKRIFYHYRRGNPTSAVSRLHGTAGRSNALVTMERFLEQWELMRPRLDPRSRALLAGRLSLEVAYHCKVSGDVMRFMQREGFHRFGLHLVPGIEDAAPDWQAYEVLRTAPCETAADVPPEVAYRAGFPEDVLALVERIEKARETSVKDLYLITGQLNTTTNAPIDSWTFFKWLRQQGVPSRYVIWKQHEWYPRLKAAGELKDVIVMDGNGVDDFEFLFKCRDVLPRCKVFAQENGALNWRLRKWFYYLPECPYVYSEHGIKYLKHSDHLGTFLSTFNAISNTSEYERDITAAQLPGYVDNGVKPTCFVGGLPRLETLKDERDPGRREFVVFVMFTWREAFNAGQEVLVKSAYYRGLQALLGEANRVRLAKVGVRFVVAAHHHLVNHIKDLSLGASVEIVPQDRIAYWKGHADCCLTDYSSIAFDYAFLDKPVVFWIPDREDPILTPNDYNEQLVAEDRERKLVNVCHTACDVVKMMEYYAARRFVLEDDKRKVMARFFDCRKDICRHMFEALERLD